MKLVYETNVTSSGGRTGWVKSDDNSLDLELSRPAALGGKEGYTNPEQLFAAAYAACFNSALSHVAKKIKIQFTESNVTASVGLFDCEEEGFKLTVKLNVNIPELSDEIVERLMHEAHKICPYSNATRNNIDVKLNLICNNKQ
ncbi:MAG: organic hydroperoxide resistance protein [Alphaproteobacteria bacterium]